MENRPKAPDVEEALAGLEHGWQELVKLLKEGRGKPSPERVPAQEFVPAGGELKEDGAPSLDLDHGHRQDSPAIPEALPLARPEEDQPPHRPAPGPTQVQLSPKGRGQRFFNISILVLLVAALGGLSFLWAQTRGGRSQVDAGSLTIRGKDGLVQAWLGERDGQVSLCLLDKAGRSRAQMTLAADGSPSLSLLDELHKNQVELKMGADGEPVLSQVKKPALPAGPVSKAPVPSGDETAALPATAAPKAPETAAALPENPANPKAAEGPDQLSSDRSRGPGSARPEDTGTNVPAAVPAGKFVGSKTSNKYHHPDCRWAKTIRPEKLVTFGSVEEARDHGYIPCPACKPPNR
ncbi:MAG: hypothetical protein NTY36_13815 [Deltaproteobacteria bacterium]|nr:hypothetical protein [Deltaproteobacteria bacterium]